MSQKHASMRHITGTESYFENSLHVIHGGNSCYPTGPSLAIRLKKCSNPSSYCLETSTQIFLITNLCF